MGNAINKRIATFRKALGYKQEDIAKMLDMKLSTYSQKERVGNIDCDFAIKVANILEIDPSIIIFGTKNVKQFIEQGNGGQDDEIIKKDYEILQLKTQIEKLNRQLEERESLTFREKDLLTAYRNVTKDKQNMIFAYAYELVKAKRKNKNIT